MVWVVGPVRLPVKCLSFPIFEMGMVAKTWQGRRQALLGSRGNAELYILIADTGSSRGCRPVPARARVRRRRPSVQEGGDTPQNEFPAPGSTCSPVEQTTWLGGSARSAFFVCSLAPGAPRPAPHSLGRQSERHC